MEDFQSAQVNKREREIWKAKASPKENQVELLKYQISELLLLRYLLFVLKSPATF